MKAATYHQYGPAEVVGIEEVERPEIGDDEVLVRTFATTVTSADWRIRASAFPGVMLLPGRLMFGLRRPRNKVLGGEFAGRVVAVGAKVTRFRMGDPVFGFALSRAHAEYLAMPETGTIAKKPANLTYEEAAAAPFGAITALIFLRDFAKLKPGEKVLVLGATGGVGVYAVQLARHFGAEVTAVCSTDHVELAASLGADRVIDYRKEDYAATGERWDLILDPVGATDYATAKRALSPNGRFVPLEFGPREVFQSLLARLVGGPRLVFGISSDSRQDVEYVAGLLATGEIRPVIDGTWPFSEIVEAYRRVETRHKTGSVVLVLEENHALRAAGTDA